MPELIKHKKPWIPKTKPRKTNKSWSHDQRYHTAKWRNYRKSFLKSNPLCVDCKKIGKVTKANTVGHIIPVSVKPELFWESSNHKALCTPCNSRQAQQDKKRYDNDL